MKTTVTKLPWLLAIAATLILAAPHRVPAKVPAGIHATEFLESKYAVILDTFADREMLKPGNEFTLAVRFVPYSEHGIKYHIYGAEKPGDFSYIPTTLAMDEAEGVTWSDAVFPPGDMLDGFSLLSGQPVATISGKLAADVAPGMRTFTAQTIFLACTEDFCLSANQELLEWKLEIVPADYSGDIVVTPHDELLAPVDFDYSRFELPNLDEPDEIVFGENSDDSTGTSGGFTLEGVNITSGTDLPFWKVLMFALLGGLILNIMPCVLPVVSIKVIDLVKNAEKEPKTVILHGFVFSAGIISTFMAGAIVIAIIQAAGTQLGWGAQFQSPGFLIVMAAIIFVFGLSMIDVFKIQAPESVKAEGGELAAKEGYSGSFFKGALATVLGTPCVGPFLGPALIVAFTLTWVHTLVIFFFVGLGMALPYLVMLPFITKMGRRERGKFSRRMLANKGWMESFKHGMSFLMFATVIYLLYILQGVMGGEAIIWTLVFLLGLAFAAWLYGQIANAKPGPWVAITVALLIALLGTWLTVPRVYASTATTSSADSALSVNTHDGWETFSLELLQHHTSAGKTVLVDFTADWCPNCKVNERVALNIESTMALKEELGIVFMVADWTQKDDEIFKVLRALGFASVPLTAVFPGNDSNSPILLDGVFTSAKVQDAMREASER